MTDEDPLTSWIQSHPFTLAYIAVVVTIVLGLEAWQVFG